MNYRERDGVIIIQHEGEITKSEGAPDLENLVKELEFKNSLVAGTKNKVILDMSKVTQVDPFGIGMIVASSMR